MPSDCKVLYTPKAAPREPVGAKRDAKLGWLASSTLKPQKNKNNRMASDHKGGEDMAKTLQAA